MFSNIVFWILTILTILTILCYKYLTRNFHYWKTRNVPFLPPTPLFGNLKEVLTLKTSFGSHLANLYHIIRSPYFGIFVGDKPVLVATDPKIIKSILVKDFYYFTERNMLADVKNDPVSAHMLFFSKTSVWKKFRPKTTPAFTTGKLKNLVPLVHEATNSLVDYIEKQGLSSSIDVKEMSAKCSTDIIALCAFGLNAYSFNPEKDEFRKYGRLFFDFDYRNAVRQTTSFLMPKLAKTLGIKITPPKLTHFMKIVFQNTVDVREKKEDKRGDFIDTMLEMKKNGTFGEGNDFNNDILIAQAGQFFIAGFETTSTTVAFTLYELSLNENIQEKIREEIKSVQKENGSWNYEMIQSLKYLEMCIQETLRKYPPLLFLERVCMKDYKIPGYNFVIEKGVVVYVPLLGLHLDPKYFPEPENYDPRRHSPENAKHIVPCSFLPFGAGPRVCLGKRIGMIVAKIQIVRILEAYKVSIAEDTPVPMEYEPRSIVIAPKIGIPLKFERIAKK